MIKKPPKTKQNKTKTTHKKKNDSQLTGNILLCNIL